MANPLFFDKPPVGGQFLLSAIGVQTGDIGDLVVVESDGAGGKRLAAAAPGAAAPASLATLTDVDLTGLAVGDHLEWDGTNWVPVEPAAGGGTTLYTQWDPFAPDAGAAESFEFATSDLSAFTAVGFGAGSHDADTTARGAWWAGLPTSQYHIRGLVKSLPAGDFTLHSAIHPQGHSTTSLIVGGGLIISTSAADTSDLMMCAAGNQSGVPSVYSLTWSNWGTSAAGAALPITTPWDAQVVFLRWRRVGSNYFWAWSRDGQGWYERIDASELHGVTPNFYGIAAQNYGGFDAQFTIPYLRRYTTGTQLKTGALVTVLG